MKRFLILTYLACATLVLQAADTINELTLTGNYQGSSKDFALSVALTNCVDITAVEFDIVVDDQDVVSGEPSIVAATRASNHNAEVYNMKNGTWKVLVYSLDNSIISGTTGEIVKVVLPNAGQNKNATFSLKNVIISNKFGVNVLTSPLTTAQSFTFDPSNANAGDLNGDGQIDSQDVFSVINMVLGKGTSGDRNAADMNGDGQIDSQDVYMIINKVLGK